MSEVVVYPGTFDPITNGHLDIIKRGVKLFKNLIVLVVRHPEKSPLFSLEERIKFIEEAISQCSGQHHSQSIKVEAFDGLLINYMREKGAKIMLRGLRAVSDFDYEFQLVQFNRKLYPEIETIFIMPSEEHFFLSSAMVKEIASYGGDVSKFVPQIVNDALKKKFENRPKITDLKLGVGGSGLGIGKDLMKRVDLHIHTIYSDGTLTPRDVLGLASDAGLSAISITDHDEIAGVEEAIDIAPQFGIEVVPGVELSARRENKSVHIIGYFIDTHNNGLISFIQSMRSARLERAKKIVSCLNGYGINIGLEDIEKHSGFGSIGRPHIASALVAKGVVTTAQEAFYKYLGEGKLCYFPKSNATTRRVIEVILNAGGIPVLAHPSSSGVDKFVPALVSEGLMGIEVWYPLHSDSEIKKYLEFVHKYNLVATGGSDSHGTRAGYPNVGEFFVEYEVLEELKIKKQELI